MAPTFPISIFICFLKLHLLIAFSIKNTTSIPQCSIGATITSKWALPEVDIVLEEGNFLEIYCSLNPHNLQTKNYTSENLIFRRENKTVHQKNIFIVNSSTARLRIENLPITNSTEDFSCSLPISTNDTKIPRPSSPTVTGNERQEHLICSKSVVVGRKPKEVSNFTCFSYSLRVLKCQWDEPNNGIETNYSLSYFDATEMEDGMEHPNLKCAIPKRNQCVWTTSTYPPFIPFFRDIFFKMRITNKFGSIIQKMRFDSFKYMILSTPTNVIALNRTAHSVYLQFKTNMWTQTKGLLFDYKVRCTPLSGQDWLQKLYLHKDVEEQKDAGIVRVNVTDLPYSDTLYEVKIFMKLNLVGDECWSLPATAQISTTP